MSRRFSNTAGWYLLILVPLLGTILFNVYPLIKTIIDSTLNMQQQFIGFTNYEIMFSNTEFKQSVANTFYMGILGVVINIPLAFILANMLNNIPRGQNTFKVFLILPMITSIVTVAILFKFIFSPDPASMANYVLSLFNIEPFAWFSDINSSRETVVMMSIWKHLGFNVILFFAGLQTIPTELYEAAKIDGANERQRWIYITIPCIRNTFIFVYLTSCIAALKSFADVYAVSGEYGDPGGSLFTIILFIYRNSFSTLFSKDVGIASAASVFLFLLILVITVINYLLTENSDRIRAFFKKR
jgi:multiple sugar transport system permease protein